MGLQVVTNLTRKEWSERCQKRVLESFPRMEPNEWERIGVEGLDSPQEASIGLRERLTYPVDLVLGLTPKTDPRKLFSDSEEVVINEQPPSKTKRKKTSSRFEAVILKDIPPPQCLQNSKDFLMKRKMQVSRSPSTLNNANQALRLVSSCGGLHS
ncbi:hypothetical protein QJS04_geneDACA023125 [Acorus gramineus]|uniref:Uncharacterized protein n=1 Tax=Acorus gramineus TaxID=55184 RepID=A0AAV9BE45_ACOGR|nr:hypothetical protein QJS04_geneDACA023125 [Acorus gramineus]